MKEFEDILEVTTSQGSNNVTGATMAVVDKEGNYIYKKTSGYNGILPDAKPLEFDQTYFIASCTKLITSIAALQAVERGLITLDEPLDQYLPELAQLEIIDSDLNLRPAVNKVTLRHLVTHSSGTTYDFVDPVLAQWRQSRRESPGFPTRMVVEEDYAIPRTFEAGEGWNYGGGLDWAGLLIARLNKTTLEEYITENIAKPLGIEAWTWHLSRQPYVAEKLMAAATRKADGVLVHGPVPPFPEPVGEGGGAGLYSNSHDYTRVLADLLKDEPVLLKKESVDALFAAQFAEGSKSFEGLHTNSALAYGNTIGTSTDGLKFNHGLGGLLIADEINRDGYYKPRGSLTWSGMPNLLWTINREKGLALFFATQIFPWADEKSWALATKFETAVWKTFST